MMKMKKFLKEAKMEDKSPSFDSTGYIALKGCSYKDQPKVKEGDLIPSDWPESAIEELLRRKVIAPGG